MPKPGLVLWIFLAITNSVFAQYNPVLMRVGGKDITRSEFERSYNKGSHPLVKKKESLEAFADSLANFYLKVSAAETAGLDTTQSFRELQATYRRKLIKDFFREGGANAERIPPLMAAENSTSPEVVCVAQIFLRLPQTITAFRLREAEARMDSIHQALKNNPQVDFSYYVKKYSDSKDTLCVSKLQYPEEFELIVFALQEGDVSKPFFTPQGIHIIKVLKHQNFHSMDETRREMANRFKQKQSLDESLLVRLASLKEEYHFSQENAGVDELLAKGATDKLLFTLDGRPYTGTDFGRFAEFYPQGLKKLYDAYVAKSVFDIEIVHLEQKHPEFAHLLNTYRDSILVAGITHLKIDTPLRNDKVALSIFFNEHKSDYRWKHPRFKGIVIHSKEKGAIKIAKKLAKKFPESEWKMALQRAFNSPGKEVVKIEDGLFAEGSNAFVDQLVFKSRRFTPMESYPFTAVIGEKQKGAASIEEAGEQVIADYREHLMSQWLMELRGKSKVEINEEVLKTVNNH